MIWLAFLEFLLVMTPTADPTPLVYLHMILGVAILSLAYYNSDQLRKTSAPARIKRVAKATFSIAVFEAVLGLLLYFDVGAGIEIPLTSITILGFLDFLHVVNAYSSLRRCNRVRYVGGQGVRKGDGARKRTFSSTARVVLVAVEIGKSQEGKEKD